MRLGKRLPNSTPKKAPNNARIIVNLHIAFENYTGTAAGGPGLPGGKIDYISHSTHDYGANAGIRRLMRILEKHSVPASVTINGSAVELYPDIARDLAAAGHELMGHGWAQDQRQNELSEDEERKTIRRCVDIISKVTGERPVGWCCPGARQSERTPTLLAEEGFTYSMDFKDDDVPYMIEVDGGRHLVVIPSPTATYDIPFTRSGQPGSVYLEAWKHAFDYFYEEGLEQPKVINALVHAPAFGHPVYAWAWEEVIKYAKSFPKVWFARRCDVADWVWSNYKASGGKISKKAQT